MKPDKTVKEVSSQMSNDERLDLIAAKIKDKDLFKKENDAARKILLKAKMQGEEFFSLKDLKID